MLFYVIDIGYSETMLFYVIDIGYCHYVLRTILSAEWINTMHIYK